MPGSSPAASPGARPPLSRSLSSAVSNATTRWGPASLTGALASPHPHPTPRSLHVLDPIPRRQSSGHHRRRGAKRAAAAQPQARTASRGRRRSARPSLRGCGKEEGQRLRGAQRRAGAEAARIRAASLRANGGAVAAQVAAPRYPEAAPARPLAPRLGAWFLRPPNPSVSRVGARRIEACPSPGMMTPLLCPCVCAGRGVYAGQGLSI